MFPAFDVRVSVFLDRSIKSLLSDIRKFAVNTLHQVKLSMFTT